MANSTDYMANSTCKKVTEKIYCISYDKEVKVCPAFEKLFFRNEDEILDSLRIEADYEVIASPKFTKKCKGCIVESTHNHALIEDEQDANPDPMLKELLDSIKKY